MKVVLTGASGQLGPYLLASLAEAGHEVVAWSGRPRDPIDGLPVRPVELTDRLLVESLLEDADPALIIHAAALSTVDGVRRDPERARAVNVGATEMLADWCTRRGRRLLYTSTDLVFDGERAPYGEDDPAEPVLLYGRTKRDAEPSVLACPGGLVVRAPLMFGPSRSSGATYLDRTLDAIRRGEPQTFFDDEYRTPLDLRTAARAMVRLAEADVAGLVHVAGAERVSRFEMVGRVVAAIGLDARLVRANRRADVPMPEPRPADVSLKTTKLMMILPDLDRPSLEAAAVALWGANR